jgi:hypothetical protein
MNEKTGARGYTAKSLVRQGTCPVEGVELYAMAPTGPCALCGAPADRVADLAPNEPLYLCERCLASWALDALAEELRRRGADPATIDRYVSAAHERIPVDPF